MRAARQLARMGLSRRDTAEILGISHQRRAAAPRFIAFTIGHAECVTGFLIFLVIGSCIVGTTVYLMDHDQEKYLLRTLFAASLGVQSFTRRTKTRQRLCSGYQIEMWS